MLKLLVFGIALIFVIGSVKSRACDGKPNKVIYNVIFDRQVITINNLLSTYNKHYINMKKMRFSIGEIEADGVQLYDVTELVPEDTYIWTQPDNVETSEINFGLNNARLLVDSLRYKGKEYRGVNVTVSNLSMKTHQITHFTRTNCSQNYANFEINKPSKVTINNQDDVTNDFNNIVVPWIMKQLNTESFQYLVEKYFNNCNPQSGQNLLALISGPYSS